MDNKKTKDSGIAWIGKIPEDWKEIRLKELFNKKQGGAWGEEAKENENDRVCIRVADFDFERQTIKEGLKTVRNYSKDNICKLQMQGNELLIEKSGGGEKTPVGRSILSNGLEGYLYANFIDKLPIKSTNHPKYIAYYMKTLYQNNIVMPYIKQTTGIQNLDVEALLFEIISVPKYIIQHQIADFLDKKCSQIDELIANNQSQIDKLKEYKQSAITQVVTKGLDPNVETKDSGIDWIGQIPKNWEVVQIKNLINVRNEKYSGGNYPYIALENIIGFECKYKQTESTYDITQTNIAIKGDVIFGKLRPYLAKVYKITENSCVSTEFAVFYSYKVNMEYFKWYLLSYGFLDTVNASTYGTKMPRANIDFIKNLPFLFHNEQQQIAEYLDKKCSQIDILIEIKQQKIEKLQEYKKSLIYEYVTGKKEVC